jgi:anti-anti-sigma factor
VIQIEGAMTSGELEPLGDTLRANAARGRPLLLLDLTAVPSVDSAALELTLEAQDLCRRRGGVVKLTGLIPLVREIFTVTRLERRFEFFDNQLTALGSFAT